jgi:hypothetical protein
VGKILVHPSDTWFMTQWYHLQCLEPPHNRRGGAEDISGSEFLCASDRNVVAEWLCSADGNAESESAVLNRIRALGIESSDSTSSDDESFCLPTPSRVDHTLKRHLSFVKEEAEDKWADEEHAARSPRPRLSSQCAD